MQKERRLQDEGAASAAAGAPTTPSAALLAALTNPRHSPSPPPAPAPAAAAATAVVVEDEEDEEEFGFGFDGVEDAEDEWDNEMETEPAAMSKRASRDRVNSETSSETSGTGKRLSHISLAGFSDVGDIDDDRESLFARGMSARSVFSVTSDVRGRPNHCLPAWHSPPCPPPHPPLARALSPPPAVPPEPVR